VYEDHFTLRCLTVPGPPGQAMKWIVRVGGQASPPSASITKYAPPRVLAANPISGPTAGLVTVQITGTNLGLAWNPAAVAIRFNSDGRMDNDLSRFLRVLDSGGLQAGETSGIPADMTRYLQLALLGGEDGARSASAIRVLEAAGYPFALSAYSGDQDAAGAARSNAEATLKEWVAGLQRPRVADERILQHRGLHQVDFVLPEGFGTDRELFLSIGQSAALSNVALVDFVAPEILNIAPDRRLEQFGIAADSLDAQTSLRLIIEGTNFCNGDGGCGAVRIDGLPINSWSWSHSEIVVLYRKDPSEDASREHTV